MKDIKTVWFKHIVDREREKKNLRIIKPNKCHYINDDYHQWNFGSFIHNIISYVWEKGFSYTDLGLDWKGSCFPTNHHFVNGSIEINEKDNDLFNLNIEIQRRHFTHNSSYVKKFYNYIHDFCTKDYKYHIIVVLDENVDIDTKINARNTKFELTDLFQMYYIRREYGVTHIDIDFDENLLTVKFHNIKYSLL